jgi:nucleotide-binding universal stress UspA family protein
MYGNVLVPTDGSDASMEALDEAIDLAEELGSSIHILYVVEPEHYAPMNTPNPDMIESMEQRAESEIERAVERAETGDVASVEQSVETGTTHETIISYIEDNDIDLVIMGTHGRTGLDRILLGSVTEKVVRLSPVPVLTVRPGEREGDEA